MKNFANIFSYVSVFSVLLPLLFFLLKQKKSNKVIIVVFALSFASFIADVINEVCLQVNYKGLIIYNSYIIVQFILFSYLYAFLITERRKLFLGGIILFIGYFIVITIFYQDINIFQSYALSISALILYIYSWWFFMYISKLKVIEKRLNNNVDHSGVIWINSGVSLYFGFNIFIFIVSNYVFKNMQVEDRMVFWSFQNLTNITKNILFAIGIYRIKV